MQNVSTMSRAELVRELIATPLSYVVPEEPQPCVTGCAEASLPETDAVSRKLTVAREILLRDLACDLKSRPVMGRPDAVREWLKLYCHGLQYEVFIVLYLDARLRLIEAETIARGTLTSVSVYPREIARSALARNACSLLVAHHHPSGETDPSQADKLLTNDLASALALVDIKLLDHFIVAEDRVLSFSEKGLL